MLIDGHDVECRDLTSSCAAGAIELVSVARSLKIASSIDHDATTTFSFLLVPVAKAQVQVTSPSLPHHERLQRLY
jgi:hypothetical protein